MLCYVHVHNNCIFKNSFRRIGGEEDGGEVVLEVVLGVVLGLGLGC